MSSVALGTAVLAASSIAQSAEHYQIADKDKEKVSLDKIPAPARDTILREAAGAKLENVEIAKWNDTTVYEAHIRKGDSHTGIVVDAKGNLIEKHDEKNEKD
jgi:uncharacterized membrane protein YkoI